MNKSYLRSTASLCVALLLTAHSALYAQTRMVGPWAIHEDPDGCSMQAQTSDGTAMGFLVSKTDTSRAELRLASSDWRSLTATAKIRVEVLINGQAQLLKPVDTFSIDGRSGLVIPFGKDYATRIFRERVTLAVVYRANTLLILYLNDPTTQAAYRAVQQCAGAHFDPFSSK